MSTLLLADFKGMATYILFILVAILVLLVMISVHELGHYIVGKIFKFKINEFSIGFGPALFKRQMEDGELFAIRAIPLGGYCAFAGEDDDAVQEGDFNSKKPWQRILVLIAGAFMNFVTAIVIAGLFFGIYGCPTYKVMSYTPEGKETMHLSAPFEEEDILVSVGGKNIYMLSDVMRVIEDKDAGETVKVVVLRDGKKVDLSVTLNEANIESIESTGETLTKLGVPAMQGVTVRFGFFEMVGRTFEYTFKLGATIFTVLGQLFTGKLGLNAMGGTVTTLTTTASGVQAYGLSYLLQISALIGVNLAVFNLLPIPALDGSKVVFTAIEWIRKKPINRKIEAVIHTIGFMLLIGFAILVDLQHCF